MEKKTDHKDKDEVEKTSPTLASKGTPGETLKNDTISEPDLGDLIDGIPSKKEDTRSKVAILFVLGFFPLFFCAFHLRLLPMRLFRI